MTARRTTSWWATGCAAMVVGGLAAMVAGSCSPCAEEEPILIEDGTYREAPGTNPGYSQELGDAEATVEDGELTIEYVGDDGRAYVIRLRERE